MIRINLLKQPAKKKIKRGKVSPKVFIIPGSIAAVVILCAGAWWAIKIFNLFSPKDRQKVVVKDEYAPSSHISTNVVEDVVDDKFDTKEKLTERGMLDYSYEKLSFIEKVNYELNFAKNVCDLLTETIQKGVNFSSIQADSFNTMKGIGVTDSKEKVVILFKSLKDHKKVELLPRPHSKFSGSGNAYSFHILCKTEFGLDLEAPFIIDVEEIINYDELDLLVKRIVDVASDEGVTIRSGPARIDASLLDGYRRIRYHFSGVSSYNTFVTFINSLYNRHVQCAFEKLKLTALSENALEIDANILFTTSQ